MVHSDLRDHNSQQVTQASLAGRDTSISNCPFPSIIVDAVETDV